MSETIKVVEKISVVKVIQFTKHNEHEEPECVKTEYWTENGEFLIENKPKATDCVLPAFLLR